MRQSQRSLPQSSESMCACLRILPIVPTEISDFLGTMAVSMTRPCLRANFKTSRLGRFEMQLQCLLQVCQSLFFSLALAGDIDLETLRYVPIGLAPNGCCERSFHELIVAYNRRRRIASSRRCRDRQVTAEK